ncbi:efflux RND transporter periplasmic adaptor subunit [Allofournierella massiliensis]|uniref:HlyD family efflux transporter periplasmic adaptor subunit n=1 Tax=Allofournierella massiliensis TaxID=1650663 RepID=A0ABT7UQ55_9FIRM|nr:efflux RND transporter periplasmic adaptor subunit [Fournierella massiliensis]MDM8201021.1 HlyD family efflux transporter periplasmic adaptor subunit [Fournierella massiliensis]
MSRIISFFGRHKKALIALAILAAVGAFGWTRMNQAAVAAQKAAEQQVQTFTLEKGDLSRTLSVSGSIQSAQVTEVAAAQTYPVAEVLVSEGDVVAEGDVIATLDTTDLDAQIQVQQEAVAAEKQQNELSISQAQRRLEDARNQKAIDEGVTADWEQTEKDAKLRQDSLAIEDAQDVLVNAVAAADAPSAAAQQLKTLQSVKAQCTITAPCSGIVTQVKAVVGGAAGAIATIENQSALEALLSVREYDINQLAVGQSVTLTSGAKDVFHGSITWIAPKATVNENGEASYAVKVSVDDATEALRLGMTAKAKVLLEEKKGVFSVPLDAVGTDENGEAVVYRKDTDAEGNVTFTPIPVTTGMETELSVEVSGEGLTEGMELRSLADPEAMA